MLENFTSCVRTGRFREFERLIKRQYAPKDKQDPSLCETPPQSVCNDEYGLSIGRGSFYFTRGKWTNIRQTVGLNAPGKTDGLFVLFVNGQLILNLTDVLYRDSVPGSTPEKKKRDGILGGILPSILGPVGSIIGAPTPTSTEAHTSHSTPRETPTPTHKPVPLDDGDDGDDGGDGDDTGTSSSPAPSPTPEKPLQFSGVFFR